MQKNAVVLKPGKEKAIRNRHSQISGASQFIPSDMEEGDLLQVWTSTGELFGTIF